MEDASCIRQQADVQQIVRCKNRLTALTDSFEHVSSGLELASNPVRMKILFLLHEERELCVCDLSDILKMTMPAVSQHLRKLKDRNLIQTERQSQTIFYSLTEAYKAMLHPIFEMLQANKKLIML